MHPLHYTRLAARLLPSTSQGLRGHAMRLRCYSAEPARRKTVAACIIGNEILSGKIQDTNMHTLSKFCFDTGLHFKRAEFVLDDEKAIGDSVRSLSDTHDLVFTSGGIGSTHDDITYQSIAKAFGCQLVEDPETIRLMEAFRRQPMNEARRRMALFPENATLIRIPPMWVPIVVVKNIHILPGVPLLFEKMLLSQRERLHTGKVLSRQYLWTRKIESDIALDLSEAQNAFPHVEIGSYPRFSASGETLVMLSFEGADVTEVQRCVSHVQLKVDGLTEDPTQTANHPA
eukprot:comp5945_c0_seq1/m.1798 comp5945_c0_seq1/g.1798  ORF comp5945_c0_seq1/g.1798 comp5945_c0_seq1/m.1798 type:complete len:287 (-) comp5945_c0_seq1:941-1801(-)